jgi:hypothetical protein
LAQVLAQALAQVLEVKAPSVDPVAPALAEAAPAVILEAQANLASLVPAPVALLQKVRICRPEAALQAKSPAFPAGAWEQV